VLWVRCYERKSIENWRFRRNGVSFAQNFNSNSNSASVSVAILYPPYQTFLVMQMTLYLKQF